MPRRLDRGGSTSTTRQKGLRNKYRGGRSTYSVKGKAKDAERYTRPYLTGEYKTWARYWSSEQQEEETGMAWKPRNKNTDLKAKRSGH